MKKLKSSKEKIRQLSEQYPTLRHWLNQSVVCRETNFFFTLWELIFRSLPHRGPTSWPPPHFPLSTFPPPCRSRQGARFLINRLQMICSPTALCPSLPYLLCGDTRDSGSPGNAHTDIHRDRKQGKMEPEGQGGIMNCFVETSVGKLALHRHFVRLPEELYFPAHLRSCVFAPIYANALWGWYGVD